MITRVRIIIMVSVVAACAAVAGLYFSGILGPSGNSHPTKVPVEPVRLTDSFIINLADTNSVHYVKLGLAVQVADMTAADHTKFIGAPGAAGSGEITGEMRLATYTPVRDAVIDVVSQFTTEQLNTADGKSQLKAELISRFKKVAAKERHGIPAAQHDPALPPYDITDVFFSDFAVQ